MNQSLKENHKEKAKLVEYVSNYTIFMGIVFSMAFLNFKILCTSILIFFAFKCYTNIIIKKYSLLKHKVLLFVLTNFSILIFCISSANVIGKSKLFFNYNLLNLTKIVAIQIIILMFFYIIFMYVYSNLYQKSLLKTTKNSKSTNIYVIGGSMSLVGASLYRALSKTVQPNNNEIVFIFGLFVFLLAIVVTFCASITFFDLKEYLQKQLEKQS